MIQIWRFVFRQKCICTKNWHTPTISLYSSYGLHGI